MRLLTGLVVATGIAAVGCTETGAHLTLSAPEGPSSATSFQVVLAAHETIPAIGGQRIAPTGTGTQTVSYFLQRTIAGADSDAISGVDGFTVRVAPDSAIAESQFIPFILMFDGEGEQRRITGIATYQASDTKMPSPILVMHDEIDKYRLTVEPLTQVDNDSLELQVGQIRVVTCFHEDQSSYTSGLVWRPRDGVEYRLMLPSDGSRDATGRELDLDCDGRAVTVETSRPDCDDTRNWFHRDATEQCDGYDTNCDNAQTLATGCTADVMCSDPFAPAPGINGVQLCADATSTESECHPTASCACAYGVCQYCKMPFEQSVVSPAADGTWHPCQPAIGSLYTRVCTQAAPCDVEVLDVRSTSPGWKIEISAPESNTWSTRAYGISETLALKFKNSDPAAEVMAQLSGPVADVDLAFITAGGTIYTSIQMRLEGDPDSACSASPTLLCN